jgi:cystathionine beta-lyase
MIAGSERVQTAFKRLPHDVTYRIGHLGIIATIAAYEHGGPWLDETLARLDKNRTVLASALRRQLPHIRYRIPDATYLAWLDCRDLPLGDDPAAAFTEHARVALAHGPAFGAAGRGFARFNFATTPGIITEAIDRIARCVAKAQV